MVETGSEIQVNICSLNKKIWSGPWPGLLANTPLAYTSSGFQREMAFYGILYSDWMHNLSTLVASVNFSDTQSLNLSRIILWPIQANVSNTKFHKIWWVYILEKSVCGFCYQLHSLNVWCVKSIRSSSVSYDCTMQANPPRALHTLAGDVAHAPPLTFWFKESQNYFSYEAEQLQQEGW